VARTAGIAADLFCAADRRSDTHSMVVHLGGSGQSAQSNSSFASTKRTDRSLAKDNLNAAAVAANEYRLPDAVILKQAERSARHC
jgi:hypothetical protein